MDASRANLYKNRGEGTRTRFAAEIIFYICVCFMALSELSELVLAKMRKGSFAAYFTSVWNYVDLLSIGFQFTCIGLWFYIVKLTDDFQTDSRQGLGTSNISMW